MTLCANCGKPVAKHPVMGHWEHPDTGFWWCDTKITGVPPEPGRPAYGAVPSHIPEVRARAERVRKALWATTCNDPSRSNYRSRFECVQLARTALNNLDTLIELIDEKQSGRKHEWFQGEPNPELAKRLLAAMENQSVGTGALREPPGRPSREAASDGGAVKEESRQPAPASITDEEVAEMVEVLRNTAITYDESLAAASLIKDLHQGLKTEMAKREKWQEAFHALTKEKTEEWARLRTNLYARIESMEAERDAALAERDEWRKAYENGVAAILNPTPSVPPTPAEGEKE